MYLSRITLGPEASSRTEYWQVFSSPWRVHQEIWRLFSDSADRRRDFLYRLDLVRGAPVVFALSARRPVTDLGLWSAETKPFEPKLREGQTLGFSLRANPVRTKNGKRHDVVMDRKLALRAEGIACDSQQPLSAIVQDAGETWLLARAERFGVRFGPLAVESHRIEEFRRKGAPPVRFSMLDFSGLLEVAEVRRFLAALHQGIGPAKAFGCGLMLVRPA